MAWIINPRNPAEELEVMGNQLTGNSRPAPGVGGVPPMPAGSEVSPPGSVATGLGPADFAAFLPPPAQPAAPAAPAGVPNVPPVPPGPPPGPPMLPPPGPGMGPPTPGELAPPPPKPPPSYETLEGGFDFTGYEPEGPPMEIPAPPPGEYEDIAILQRRQQELAAQAQANEIDRRKVIDEKVKQVDLLRRDVSSYKVDPSYVFSGRPIMKPLTESPERLAAKQKATTKELASMKLSDDPDERRRQLARAAVEKGRAMREENVEVGREGEPNPLAKIGLILAAALNSYASGRAGRDPTVGIQLIDSVMNRDMEAQKIELEKRKDLMGSGINTLGQMRQVFESERAAENALQAMQIQAARAELDKIATRADTEAKRVAAQQMDVQLGQRGQQLMLDAIKFENDALMRRQELGVSKYDAQTRRLGVLLEKDREAKAPALKQQEDFGAVLESMDGLRDLQDAWGRMRESGGWEPTGKTAAGAGVATAGAEYMRTKNQLTAKIAKQFGSNPTDKDAARTEDLTPDPGDSEATGWQKIEAQKKTIINKALTQLKVMDAAGMDTTAYRKELARKMALLEGNVSIEEVK